MEHLYANACWWFSISSSLMRTMKPLAECASRGMVQLSDFVAFHCNTTLCPREGASNDKVSSCEVRVVVLGDSGHLERHCCHLHDLCNRYLFCACCVMKFIKEKCISMSPWGLIFSTPFDKNSFLWSLKNEKGYLLQFMLIQFYGCDCLVASFIYLFYF